MEKNGERERAINFASLLLLLLCGFRCSFLRLLLSKRGREYARAPWCLTGLAFHFFSRARSDKRRRKKETSIGPPSSSLFFSPHNAPACCPPAAPLLLLEATPRAESK